ncbi:NAD(P)H-binding protein [Actinoplanes sp. NPDC051411]|uniref:NAD(P)H-binding protein n=1 Tax=Actinoplanes sp. NPDC051411 TaxID=3155522 RepID=UPI0034414886
MIVVTAPTGNIGRQVVANLLARDTPVRVVVRDPDRLAGPVRERAEIVVGSHADPDVVAKAFDGADAVFWLVPPDRQAPDVRRAFLDFTRPAARAFAEAETLRVVGVSALGRGTAPAADAGLVTASLEMDDLIAASGVAYRALALPSFMDNVLRQVAVIRDQGRYYGPSEPGRKMPTCATRDIAAVAAGLLLDDTWSGVDQRSVLGPEDLSMLDEVRIMSEVLGRPIEYVRTPLDAFKAQFLAAGASESTAQAMADMARAKDEGLDAGVARTAETAGPTTFRAWCEEVLKPAVQS